MKELIYLGDQAKIWGDQLQCSPKVHLDDFIFRWLLDVGTFEKIDHAVSYYFRDGLKSASKLRDILTTDLGLESGCLLEFASGYGCVTRHLKRVLPEFSVVSCDIHERAVQFIREQLRVDAILSHSIPEQLPVEKEKFDVVFALSFFSHMPRATWGRWLKALHERVRPGGWLLFTTHGDASRKFQGDPTIPEDGFWFKADSEQKDLTTSEYGLTITLPAFVEREISQLPKVSTHQVRLAYWWEHQDLYIVRKANPAHVSAAEARRGG